MTFRKTLIIVTISILIGIISCSLYLNSKDDRFNYKIQKLGRSSDAPPSLQLYNLIENASDSFNIPRHILYNVAFKETRYQGPFDWGYNPYQTSIAGAVGPMQIITRYAHSYAGRNVTTSELKNNLSLNVEISCKMLKSLYSKYKRWDLVLGYYNTGNPIVNSYASFVSSNKDYKSNWIKSE